MNVDDVDQALAEHGYVVSREWIASLLRWIDGEMTDAWEPWRPSDWLPLHDALRGWDCTGAFGIQTDRRDYVGPAGIGIAGNAAEHMLCLLSADHPHRLRASIYEWDQTLGCFRALAELG